MKYGPHMAPGPQFDPRLSYNNPTRIIFGCKKSHRHFTAVHLDFSLTGLFCMRILNRVDLFSPFVFFFLSAVFFHPSFLFVSPPTTSFCLLFLLHLPSVYCVTSAAKDERYRAPPPTPPGYQGLALGDGPHPPLPHPRPPHLRPPDYSVALQRSRLLQSPGGAGGPGADGAPRWSRPASICMPQPELLLDSEDGTTFPP